MLYLIRHGRTDWNEMHKLQGRTDIPLNAEGRAMAERAALECRAVPFGVCFSSPLLRARQTAEILLRGRDVPIEFDDRLMEMCFGDAEGLGTLDQPPDSPVTLLFTDPGRYFPPEHGESMAELFERTGAFLREKAFPLLERGLDVLIVGHGAMNASIICRMNGLSPAHFWDTRVENCKLMTLPFPPLPAKDIPPDGTPRFPL